MVLATAYRQVDSDDVSEPLLVVEEGGEVGDEDDEDGGHVDRHEGAEQPPAEAEGHRDAAIRHGLIYSLLLHIILGEVYWPTVYYVPGNWGI